MSLIDDACPEQTRLEQINAKLSLLQAVLERHERIIDQQGEVLERLTGFMSENRPTLKEIIEAVCEFYQITPLEIISECRLHCFSHPRLIVYYLGRKLTRISLQGIANRLGKRDHTTIRAGFHRISAMIRRNEVLRDDIDVLRARIAEKVMERELNNLRGGIAMLPKVIAR